MDAGKTVHIEPVRRAIAAFLPAFAILREGRPEGSFIGDSTDAEVSFEPIVENGIELADAVAFLSSACEPKPTKSPLFYMEAEGYHLIAASPDETSAAGTDPNSLMEIVRAQFELAVGLLQRETQLQHCMEERKLIAASLDSLPLSIFVLDRDRRYIFQNASDRETFIDLHGKRIEQTDIDPAMAAKWAKQHEEVLSEGKTFDRQDENQSHGQVFMSRTLMAPVRDEAGISGIVGLAIDCTAEATAVILLEQTQTRLQAWLKLSSDWAWEADDQHRFTLVEGDSAVQRLDFSNWIGHQRWEIVGVDPSQDDLWGDYKQMVDNRQPIRSFRFQMMRDDGTPLIAEVNADPIFDATGAFTGYRGVTRDVTDREELLSRLQRAEMIANETQHGIVITDAQGRITWVNPAFSETTGYALDEVIGYTPGAILQCPETNPETVKQIRHALRNGQGIRTTILNRAKNGRHYWLDLEIRPIYCSGGKVDGFIAVENDITDLIDDKTRKDAIFENATAGIVIHDESGATIDCNFEAARILGVTTDQLLGRTAMDPAWHLVDDHGAPLSAENVPAMRALNRKEPVRNQIVGVRDGSGQTRWLRANAQVFAVGTDKSQVLVSFSDVTEEENARRDVETARELMSTIIETMPDGVAAFDQDDRLLLCNSAYKQIYPRTAPAMHIGASFESILRYSLQQGEILNAGQSHSEHEAWLKDRMQLHRQPKAEPSIQRLSDGRWLQIRERVSPSGVIVGIRSDITALKRAEQKVRLAAEQDALTGLANRTAFIRSFEQSLNGSRATDGTGLVALIDLDHFKDLNDTLGHDVGDAFLKEISKPCLSA